jgi:hypothetical protein
LAPHPFATANGTDVCSADLFRARGPRELAIKAQSTLFGISSNPARTHRWLGYALEISGNPEEKSWDTLPTRCVAETNQ